MVEKKAVGVKSVTLGDVKATDLRSGVKATPSASSTIPEPPSDEELKQMAKDADDEAKAKDDREKMEGKQAKQSDKDAKQTDAKVTKSTR